MRFKNTRVRKDFLTRRNERFSQYGRDQEKDILELLSSRKNVGGDKLFHKVVYHKPNSPEDRSGKDFSVCMLVDGKEMWKSFGVTISQDRHALSKRKHSDVVSFCTLIGFNAERFIKKVLALFK